MSVERNAVPSFYSGFLKLFSGLAIVQLLNLGFSLLLPRFYAPEDYALFGIFTAVAFILLEVIILKLDITIFFPKEDQEAIEIIHAIFLVAMLITVVLLLTSILLSIYYNPIFILLPALLLIYGFAQPLTAWFTRKQQYNIVNKYRILVAIVTPILSLLFIIYLHWGFGLVLGFIVGQLSGLLYLFFSFDYVDVRLIQLTILKSSVNRYKQFPTYGVLSSLVNSISRNSIVLLIEHFFGVFYTGFYTMSSRILNAPIGMYQNSLSQVYIQQAAQLDNQELKAYTKKIVAFGFALGIIPVAIGFAFGPELFSFLFGPKWMEAGKITQYIIWWYFSMAVINPVGMLVDIKQKLKFEFSWNLMLLLLRVGVLSLGVMMGNFYLMLALLSFVGIAMNLYILWYVFRLTDGRVD